MSYVLIRQFCGDFDIWTDRPLAVGDETEIRSLRDDLEAADKDAQGDDPSVKYAVSKLPDTRERRVRVRDLLKEDSFVEAPHQTAVAGGPCPLCKGKGTAIAVDAILPTGEVKNPRKAVCMVCDGSGICPPTSS